MSAVRVPKYRHYKPKNLAVVRIAGKDHYLGPYGSSESHEKYRRLVAEHFQGSMSAEGSASGGPSASASRPSTVAEVVAAYRRFARAYYVRGDEPTKEYVEMRYAARPLLRLFSSLPAESFGPKALRTVQRQLESEARLSRRVINRRINRIRRIFKWAVSEELVPLSLYEGLRTLPPLKYGRTAAPEAPPVTPVPWQDVEPVLEAVSRPVRAMIRLQWLTAMRPCEVVSVVPLEIDRSGEIWVYAPRHHKNRWRGTERRIPLGPKAQQVLAPFLLRGPMDPLFSPKEAECERNAVRRSARRSPMTPSQRGRLPKQSSTRAKRDAYDVASYRRAIAYAIARINRGRKESDRIPLWSPLQLRHSRATEVRRLYGLEGAQVTLGHAHADVTQVYAERDLEAAIRIAREIG